MATSGMRGGDIVSLTIQDFLEASSIYNHSSNLDKLLSKNPYEIIPCHDFFTRKLKKKVIFVSLLILVSVLILFLSILKKGLKKDIQWKNLLYLL
jgi:hypothetical protein